jgi:hypothetical protein
MSPYNFWFFGWVKTALQTRRYIDADVVVKGLTDLFDILTFEALQRVFQK